jgi:hypothetical protein
MRKLTKKQYGGRTESTRTSKPITSDKQDVVPGPKTTLKDKIKGVKDKIKQKIGDKITQKIEAKKPNSIFGAQSNSTSMKKGGSVKKKK